MLKAMMAAGAATFISTIAVAQGPVPCAPRPQVVQELDEIFHESQVAVGLTANGEMLELFASPTRSWTLLATRPDGITCVVVFGSGLETMPIATRTAPADPA
jgi:hypothetical protein